MSDRPARACVFEVPLARAEAAGDVIGQITVWQNNPNLVQVITQPGCIVARVRPEDIDQLDLRVGLPISAIAESLRCTVARDHTRRIALGLLARRDFSSAALLERLVKRGSTRDIAQNIVTELIDQGWIDDARYARVLAEQSLARGQATAPALAIVMARHQIQADVSEQIIAQVLADVDPVELALGLASKRLHTMPDDLPEHTRRRRLGAYLARRGFDEDTIGNVLNQHMGLDPSQ